MQIISEGSHKLQFRSTELKMSPPSPLEAMRRSNVIRESVNSIELHNSFKHVSSGAKSGDSRK